MTATPSIWQLFVRHAHRDAVSPVRNNGLSPKGHEQMVQLVERLKNEYPNRIPRRVLSSPKLRCQETAAYLARYAGLSVEIENRLDEQHSHETFEAFSQRLELFLTQHQTDTGLCMISHGDVLPVLSGFLGAFVSKIPKGDIFWSEDGKVSGLNSLEA